MMLTSPPPQPQSSAVLTGFNWPGALLLFLFGVAVGAAGRRNSGA
ncbi:MAG: hypothetical protein U0Z53_23050 [Blastocatellia bacterium]